MRLMLSAALAAVILAGLVPPAAAQDAPRIVTAEDLDILANFFLPGAMTEQLIRGGCRTAYQTKRARNAADLALERALPGVTKKMITAAGAYCDAEASHAIARWHNAIKADWRTSTKPADLHRLALFLGPAVRDAQAIRFEVRPGETVVASFDRAWPNAAAQEKRLRTAQAAFVKTPSDAALVNRVAEYQRRVQKEAENPHGPIAAVIQGGLAAAHRAANAYAREKGFNAPYPNE